MKLKWNNEHVKKLFLSNFYGKQYIVKTRYFCIFTTKNIATRKTYMGERGVCVCVCVGGGGGGGVGTNTLQ